MSKTKGKNAPISGAPLTTSSTAVKISKEFTANLTFGKLKEMRNACIVLEDFRYKDLPLYSCRMLHYNAVRLNDKVNELNKEMRPLHEQGNEIIGKKQDPNYELTAEEKETEKKIETELKDYMTREYSIDLIAIPDSQWPDDREQFPIVKKIIDGQSHSIESVNALFKLEGLIIRPDSFFEPETAESKKEAAVES